MDLPVLRLCSSLRHPLSVFGDEWPTGIANAPIDVEGTFRFRAMSGLENTGYALGPIYASGTLNLELIWRPETDPLASKGVVFTIHACELGGTWNAGTTLGTATVTNRDIVVSQYSLSFTPGYWQILISRSPLDANDTLEGAAMVFLTRLSAVV